jgi:hypothetical protein
MKMDAVLDELEAAASKLGVKVSYEVLAETVGGGGLCKVKGAWRVIVEKRGTAGERASTLAKALATFDTEGIFLTPAARDLVDRYRPRRAPGEESA